MLKGGGGRKTGVSDFIQAEHISGWIRQRTKSFIKPERASQVAPRFPVPRMSNVHEHQHLLKRSIASKKSRTNEKVQHSFLHPTIQETRR